MRFSRTQFIDSCKSFFRVEFTPQDITAYGGLELIRRYFRLIGLHRRVQSAFRQYQLGGEYGAVDMILVILALLLVRRSQIGTFELCERRPTGEAVLQLVPFALGNDHGSLVEALYAAIAAGSGGVE